MIKEIYESYAKLIKKLKEFSNLTIDEDHKVLRLDDFECNDQLTFDLLSTFINEISGPRIEKYILKGNIHGEFDLNSINFNLLKDDILKLVVHKSSDNGFYGFISINGLKKAFESQEFISDAKLVWVLENFFPFSSITTKFCPWGDDRSEVLKPDWEGLIDPREIVRELTVNSNLSVPNDIRPWLLKPNQNLKDSIVFNTWKISAVKKLSLSLPSEVKCSSNSSQITFRGEKLRHVNKKHLSDEDCLRLFDILHRCAEWIFNNLQNAETKHILLNYQLAFEWSGEETWPNETLLERAFESACEAFQLYLHENSKDLLKSLSEIKKNLHDEVNRVSNNTRDLISNFWRDFAIAAVVLIIKYVTGSQNINLSGIRILYTATSTFLLISLIITIFINARFNKITKDNRANWRDRLYPFLSDKTLEKLVTIPIKKSIFTYRLIAAITFLIYLAIAFYLLNLAYSFI